VEGAEEVARLEANDLVVSAITGIEGLRPTLAAVEAGRRVALANKESLVVAGGILRARAKVSGARIIPVDSEHSGIFQCLAGQRRESVRKVTLTASGGPFFRTPLHRLKERTVAEALAHPRWKMGRKVTIDSATLMNKGLELIEARWLFGLKSNELDILIHPQSIVHSLVEMRDGSTLAQLSVTDMKIPIQYALTYPEREDTPLAGLDLSLVRSLEFFAVDERRYPLIRLARQALETEKSLPVALNAANEVAVGAFLNSRINFSGIAEAVGGVLDRHELRPVNDLESVFDVDFETRRRTEKFIRERF
jgi:1-deoxy-D-xylulose-5-phosphate reductoisomerase